MAKKKEIRPSAQSPVIIAGFYAFIVIAFFSGLLAGYIIWGSGKSPSAAAALPEKPPNSVQSKVEISPAAPSQQAPTQQPRRYNVSTDDNPSIGPANAPVTIIEFSDYQCPYCRRWANQVEKQILQHYGDKVRIVYRDFPLTKLHPYAFSAAEAADCAGEQGKYWEYHDALFQQKHGLGEEAYKKYAQDLGLDMDKFNQCMKEHRYKDEVQNDLNYALKIGVKSTPTFFINGRPLVGAWPFDKFKQVIDEELGAK